MNGMVTANLDYPITYPSIEQHLHLHLHLFQCKFALVGFNYDDTSEFSRIILGKECLFLYVILHYSLGRVFW